MEGYHQQNSSWLYRHRCSFHSSLTVRSYTICPIHLQSLTAADLQDHHRLITTPARVWSHLHPNHCISVIFLLGGKCVICNCFHHIQEANRFCCKKEAVDHCLKAPRRDVFHLFLDVFSMAFDFLDLVRVSFHVVGGEKKADKFLVWGINHFTGHFCFA